MIICLTAQGRGLDAPMDASFGRAPFFLFVDETDGRLIEAVENQPSAHGAGVQAAQTVAAHGARVLLTAHVGPNAFSGLDAADVAIYVGASGTAEETLAAYREGRLTRTAAPTSGGHGGGARR